MIPGMESKPPENHAEVMFHGIGELNETLSVGMLVMMTKL